MKSIALVQQKGGAGKTTLALHLAQAFAQDGKRTLLIDADPQGSALDWSSVREDMPFFTVIGLPKPVIHREIGELGKDYDRIVIDSPPRVYDVGRSAIAAADLALVPVSPSPFDVWAAKESVDLIREAANFSELKSAFVVNRIIVNTAIGRDIVESLNAYGIPIAANSIGQRVAFAEAMAEGRTVLEIAPKGKAAAEILNLVEEVSNLLSDDTE